MAELRQEINIVWGMADPEGTAPVRAVADHARRVGEGWIALGDEMGALADHLDVLVAGSTPATGEETDG